MRINTEDKDTDNIINEKNKENSRSDYNNIYETLKAMIPPEQMETYENLRMLLIHRHMMIVTNPMKKVSDIMTDNLNNGNPKLKM